MNGKTINTFSVRNIVGNVDVRITVWPELAEKITIPAKGEFVAIEGKHDIKPSKDGSKDYHNLSATQFVSLGAGTSTTPLAKVVQKAAVAEPAF